MGDTNQASGDKRVKVTEFMLDVYRALEEAAQQSSKSPGRLLRQKDIASAAGVDAATISRWSSLAGIHHKGKVAGLPKPGNFPRKETLNRAFDSAGVPDPVRKNLLCRWDEVSRIVNADRPSEDALGSGDPASTIMPVTVGENTTASGVVSAQPENRIALQAPEEGGAVGADLSSTSPENTASSDPNDCDSDASSLSTDHGSHEANESYVKKSGKVHNRLLAGANSVASGGHRVTQRMRRHWKGLALLAALIMSASVVSAIAFAMHDQPRAVAQSTQFYVTATQVSLAPILAKMNKQHIREGGFGQTSPKTMVPGFFLQANVGNICLNSSPVDPASDGDGDSVHFETCDRANSQIWVPIQFDIDGYYSTWLISYAYPWLCLDADKINGLVSGSQVQLWTCHSLDGRNERWSFGDLLDRTRSPSSYGYLCLSKTSLCLDVHTNGSLDVVQIR